jgi:hypothetical protein
MFDEKFLFKNGGKQYNHFLNELFNLNVDFYTKDHLGNINHPVDTKIIRMTRNFRFKSESDYVVAKIIKT